MDLLILLAALAGLTARSGILHRRLQLDMFVYYTNLSNLLILIYFLLRVVLPRGTALYRFLDTETVFFSVMMAIGLTFLIYHFLLLPQIRATRAAGGELGGPLTFSSIMAHYVVPWLTILNWVVRAPKARLTYGAAFAWFVIPFSYFAFALIRAPFSGNLSLTDSPYPYPFMDPTRIGWRGVFVNVTLIFAGCVMLGVAVIGVTRFAGGL